MNLELTMVTDAKCSEWYLINGAGDVTDFESKRTVETHRALLSKINGEWDAIPSAADFQT